MQGPNIVDKQNATSNAISNATPDWSKAQFREAVERAAKGTAKGITIDKRNLRIDKLINTVRTEYKSHYPAIYKLTDRVPPDVNALIIETVQEYVQEACKLVNHTNVVSSRTYFKPDFHNMRVLEAVQLNGENPMSLERQISGCDILIEKCTADLDKVVKQNSSGTSQKAPDYERETALKTRLQKLYLLREYINKEVQLQEKLKSDSAKA